MPSLTEFAKQRFARGPALPPFAPVFASMRHYREAFTDAHYIDEGPRMTVGQEWEYYRPLQLQPQSMGYMALWRRAWMLSGHWDGSGEDLYELSLPPVDVPADYLDPSPLGYPTALLFLLDVPIYEHGVAGRHVHVTPVLSDAPASKALRCSAPLMAARVEYRNGSITPVFRESIIRYSYFVDRIEESHYAAVNRNPADSGKPLTIEIRTAETPPIISGIGAWVAFNAMRGRPPRACEYADRISFYSHLTDEACRDEYCRDLLEAYRQLIEERGVYIQSWRSFKPMYEFIYNHVAHLIDVAESMRSVEVKRIGRNRATCYRCNNMPDDIMDVLPTTYERLLEAL
jgi:hypothetical protein